MWAGRHTIALSVLYMTDCHYILQGQIQSCFTVMVRGRHVGICGINDVRNDKEIIG